MSTPILSINCDIQILNTFIFQVHCSLYSARKLKRNLSYVHRAHIRCGTTSFIIIRTKGLAVKEIEQCGHGSLSYKAFEPK